MLELMASAGLALLALLGLSPLLRANLFWRRRRRDFFDEAVRQLLIGKDDGGALLLRPRQTGLRLRMRRGPGRTARAARLGVVLPAEVASSEVRARLAGCLRARGIEARFGADAAGGAPGEVVIEVPDIWAPDAGAAGGGALRCVVDALGVPRDARYIIDLSGPDSLRALRRLGSRLRG